MRWRGPRRCAGCVAVFAPRSHLSTASLHPAPGRSGISWRPGRPAFPSTSPKTAPLPPPLPAAESLPCVCTPPATACTLPRCRTAAARWEMVGGHLTCSLASPPACLPACLPAPGPSQHSPLPRAFASPHARQNAPRCSSPAIAPLVACFFPPHVRPNPAMPLFCSAHLCASAQHGMPWEPDGRLLYPRHPSTVDRTAARAPRMQPAATGHSVWRHSFPALLLRAARLSARLPRHCLLLGAILLPASRDHRLWGHPGGARTLGHPLAGPCTRCRAARPAARKRLCARASLMLARLMLARVPPPLCWARHSFSVLQEHMLLPP